jgi:hypothetical protein
MASITPANERRQLRRSVQTYGGLSAASRAYKELNAARYGAQRTIRAGLTIAGRTAKPGQPKPRSTVTAVGKAPKGFGKQVLWDAGDPELALVIFLNAADPYGVMISGAEPTDSIEFINSAGIASFSEATENEDVGSFIGVVAVGANLGAAAFGAPAAAPLINAAAAFAQDQFKEKQVKTMRRDAFGEDPGNGQNARAEGGVIVSMPEAQQIFYSGNAQHKERWIKPPGTRDNAHRPNHVRNAYFLDSGSSNRNKRKALAAGDFIISAWDHKFDDNFGFYRLHAVVKRGDGRLPAPRTPQPVE